MKLLKNWDNKTWLSSTKYIQSLHSFLKKKIRFNNNLKIIDIGCGRANIISFLQKKYKFKKKPIGIDIVKNKSLKKNILFKKSDALEYLKKNKKFNLIIIKQTIHFFSKSKLKILLKLCKESLNVGGILVIFSLKTKDNKIPCFNKMKQRLDASLKRDETLLKIIKKELKNITYKNFNFKVVITKKKYIKMLKTRYISCLLNISEKDLNKGISEINLIYKNQIKFTDTLNCIFYKK